MYLYLIVLLSIFTKINYTLVIKHKSNIFNHIHFLNTHIPRKQFNNIIYLTKKETPRHEIYRKRFEKEIKNALQSIIYKKGIKFNYKYHIDEDIIEGITIHNVQLSSDCSVAKVIIEIMGDSVDSKQGYIWIKKNCKHIRYKLAELIKHRKRVPFLNFVLSNLSEQTQLFCEIENIREYYGDMFKDELNN
ncbi:ribosome-binding factor A, putative [Plasmodium berghei]|uniref:Ribosome-binding factor A, putative n=2 Tax=Plasmodium berghei TaxID=5821 RepID=A0A509ALD9_PLABA|nr:ribosome-binding factor A, putative [Plasmodium berghei ANKA]CXI72547.1 ribosome-binding factor A, putative [Plasmodium berghei]SCM24425.1 ribosome-binding factor A, putative [Plasmodium berghei]SCN27059.1 ribosome-binding factor A, putative [Plasmodium berghei]SCO61538.1 ribosome-binding factor A, putative [Plasmodium berghei]SCO63481.1 ribosome-binding factor A, putative [Plasmodium berghei]|eukprot:XP_034422693.1 ribosome-binding factor A, putative [Plasmodium berghei ANKA]